MGLGLQNGQLTVRYNLFRKYDIVYVSDQVKYVTAHLVHLYYLIFICPLIRSLNRHEKELRDISRPQEVCCFSHGGRGVQCAEPRFISSSVKVGIKTVVCVFIYCT